MLAVLFALIGHGINYVQAQEAVSPVLIEDILTIHLSGGELGERPVAVTTNADLNLVAVANEEGENIDLIDGISHQIIATFDIDVSNSVQEVAENVSTGLLYIAIVDSEDMEVLDTAIGQALEAVKLGHAPSGISVNPLTNKIYVTNKDGGSISVIDGRLNLKTDTITIGGSPAEIAVNPLINFLYIGHKESGTLTVFDLNNNKVFKEVEVTIDPSDIVINGPAETYYVSESIENGVVFALNGRTNEIVDTIQLGEAFDANPEDTSVSSLTVTGMAVNDQINSVYFVATGTSSDTLFVIDGNDNSIVKEIELERDIHEAQTNLGSDFIYVTNKEANTVSVINGIRNKRLFDIGSKFNGYKIAINSRTNKAYVTSRNNVGVRVIGEDVIGGVPNVLLDTIKVLADESEVGIDQINNLVYLASEGFITITDGVTNDVVGKPIDVRNPIDGGDGVDNTTGAIAVNSVTHQVYAGAYDEINDIGKVKVIDGTKNELTSEIDVGGIPSSIKINPETNRIYVVVGSDVKVIDGDSNQIIARINTTLASSIIGVNKGSNSFYIGDGRQLSVFDGITNRMVRAISLDKSIADIAVNDEDNRIFLAISGTDLIETRDGATLELLASFKTRKEANVSRLGFDPNTDIIYVTHEDSPLLALFQDSELLRPLPNIANLVVTFDPNPVLKDTLRRGSRGQGRWEFRIFLTETNGVDVTITDFSIASFGFIQEKERPTFVRWFDECGKQERGIVPGFDTACADIVINADLDDDTPFIWTFKGVDANGNDVEASGTVLLLD